MSAGEAPATRRAALTTFAAALMMPALPALADDEIVAPPPPPPPPPKPMAVVKPESEYKLKKDYPKDARSMLDNMVIATELARGADNMEYIVKSTRSEMNDFVAFYRRQPKVAGMPSFSTMYTAINTLSGHYASYGNKYPVPEKRRVRLKQQVRTETKPTAPLRQCHCRAPALTRCLPLPPTFAVQGDRARPRAWQVGASLEAREDPERAG